jgi:hypothetical protein
VTGTILLTAGWGATLFVIFHLAWPGDLWLWPMPDSTPRLIATASLFGLGLALEGVAVTSVFWWLERDDSAERMELTTEFARFGPRTLRRLPDRVDEFRLWQYMVAVAKNRVTLSQDGAATMGLDRDQSNAVKDWLAAVGWWEWTNRDNATGEWTERGSQVLEMLRREPPALWDEIVEEVG